MAHRLTGIGTGVMLLGLVSLVACSTGESEVVFTQHEGAPRSVAALADGRVASGDALGVVLVWNPDQVDAEPVRLVGHERIVLSLEALDDGRLVSSGPDGVLLWDLGDPTAPSARFDEHDDTVGAVEFLADGRVASGDDVGVILIWDPVSLEVGVSLRHGLEPVEAIIQLADGRVATGGHDGLVKVWDLSNPAMPEVEFNGYGPPGSTPVDREHVVFALAELPDGRIVSGGSDSKAFIWDPADPSQFTSFDGPFVPVHALAVLADGRVVSGDSIVRLWDPDAPADEERRARQAGISVDALAVLDDGRVVYPTDIEGEVVIWTPPS